MTDRASARSGLSAFGCIVVLGAAASLCACSRPPPLAPELKAITCPTNRQEHASATFAKARIIFPCISKELADSPFLLRCDLESRPMICEDDGSLMYSRNAGGAVYVGEGALPDEATKNEKLELQKGRRYLVRVGSKNRRFLFVTVD